LARRLGIENLVHFHGAMPSHAVRELLDDCDVFVLAAVRTGSTSFQRGCMDGIPVALMEAMASGLPVISTSISGIPELVVERAGILVSPGDVSALAQAILEVHRDPALGSSRARRARQHVEQHFDADAQAGKLVELLVTGASPNWRVVQGTAADATGRN
jgi:colanic acid/amylovoran biosynthesis glycosyltransferase